MAESMEGSSVSSEEHEHEHDKFCTTWRTDLKICRGLCLINDCKVYTKTGSFKVHSAFVKVRCPVMASMLEQNPDEIDLRKFDHDAINTLIEYIYTGEVQSIKIDSACELYEAAHMLQLPLLKKHCIRFLKKRIMISKVPELARLALEHEETRLMSKVKLFCAKNLLEVVKTKEWVDFLGTNPQLANEILQEALEINQVKD